MNGNTQALRESSAFFNGQRLEAADLEALVARQRELRWLHNRTLHNWGIASGLGVVGEKDARQVQIGRGYAIDSDGREILLSEPHTEPIPPVAGENDVPVKYYLTISFPETANTAETREGICLPRGAVRLLEKPVFCWIKLDEQGRPDVKFDPALALDIKNGRKIVLAQIEVFNCKLAKTVSLRERRNVQPVSQPYIVAARTTAEATVWDTWKEDQDAAEIKFGIQATVKTSAAGFRQVPNYMARIEGKRHTPYPLPPKAKEFDIIAQLLIHIDAATTDQFTLRVFVTWVKLPDLSPVPNDKLTMDDAKNLANALNWRVVWMGVEG